MKYHNYAGIQGRFLFGYICLFSSHISSLRRVFFAHEVEMCIEFRE